MITIVSLGTERGDLTLRGMEALRAGGEVLVRTEHTPAAAVLEAEHIPFVSLDFLYEKSRTYDTLTKNLVKEVKRRAKSGPVCYCTDGSGREDEAALLLMKEGAALIDAPSKSARLAALAGLGGDYLALSAFSVKDKKLTLPLVVYDLTADNASDVKLLLSEAFSDEAPVLFAGEKGAREIPLYETDRRNDFGALSGLVIREIPLLKKKRFDFEDTVAVLKRLRQPDGCPWDRVQTHESIRINAIEEAYELVDAIDQNDPEKMCEEAGDVLMQALFHALIEEEKGNFTVKDMVSGLCEKLVSRHTHVFGKDVAAGAEGALSVWEKNKMSEKHQTTYSDAVNDVPACFPALLRAQKVAKRVEKGGWDGSTLENAEKKLREEHEELLAAYRKGDKGEIEEELGDFLMCAAWLARAVGADAEMALLDAVKKLQRRYTAYEALVRADGKDPTALTQEERDGYYERAKRAENA